MPMPAKTCTHGTFFVLEYSVAVSSPGHGEQVSVSPLPRFHSVVLPWHRVYSLITEAILMDSVCSATSEPQ